MMPEQKTARKISDAVEFGQLLHTGMRKGLDGWWSVLAWNLVEILPADDWMAFLKWAEPTVAEWSTPIRGESVQRLFTDWAKGRDALRAAHFRETGQVLKRNARAEHLERCFAATLQICPDDDCKALAEWLNYCLEA